MSHLAGNRPNRIRTIRKGLGRSKHARRGKAIEKGSDTDLLRDMIQFVCQRMMELDVEGRGNEALGEPKPGERVTHRFRHSSEVADQRIKAREAARKRRAPTTDDPTQSYPQTATSRGRLTLGSVLNDEMGSF